MCLGVISISSLEKYLLSPLPIFLKTGFFVLLFVVES